MSLLFGRWRLWRPRLMPTGVLSRIRWLFLGFAFLNVVGMVPLLMWSSTLAPGPRVAGAIACVVLVGLWVRGYRRAQFPLRAVVLELVALLTVTVTVGHPEPALGLIFAGANFRATYGTKRDLVVTVLTYTAAYLGGQLIVDAQRFADGLGNLGPQLIALQDPTSPRTSPPLWLSRGWRPAA